MRTRQEVLYEDKRKVETGLSDEELAFVNRSWGMARKLMIRLLSVTL